MNKILLHPTDTLFFRDGRPMSGASSGHGAAWPLPTVVNHAFHAALHRSGIESHKHVPGRSSMTRDYSDANRENQGRVFGSLLTAGPFPVCTIGEAHTWFFPRPADANDQGEIILSPYLTPSPSSLPAPCKYSVGSCFPPSKEKFKPWWSEGAWNAYLGTEQRNELAARSFVKNDSDFSDAEHAYGIAIDSDTNAVEEGKFYSANYLRLREEWRLGVFAEAFDKKTNADLVGKLLNDHGTKIIMGGQQRTCTARRETQPPETRLPLPLGRTNNFEQRGDKWLVKWILLTPAIFPQIGEHSGGWLPSWVDRDGKVQLLDGPGKNYAKRHNVLAGKQIDADLVAAIVGKSIPVTGYALPHEVAGRSDGGAKPTHLAVPAGSVYYFEARTQNAAESLAKALNWHGDTCGLTIKNRRSTLMGEKGLGLGVCGTWKPEKTEGTK